MSDPMEQPQALYDDDDGALPISEVKKHVKDNDVQKTLNLLERGADADTD